MTDKKTEESEIMKSVYVLRHRTLNVYRKGMYDNTPDLDKARIFKSRGALISHIEYNFATAAMREWDIVELIPTYLVHHIESAGDALEKLRNRKNDECAKRKESNLKSEIARKEVQLKELRSRRE